MNQRFKAGLAGLAVAGIAGLLVWGFLGGRAESARDLEGEQSLVPPQRIVRLDGQVVVELDSVSRARAGLRIVSLDSTRRRRRLTAYGHVVEIDRLAEFRSRYATARAAVEKTQARLTAASRERERLLALHEDRQIVSAETLERAVAVYQTDKAEAEAADRSARALAGALREEWGAVISDWLMRGSPALVRILSGREVLIQATLPPPATLAAPPRSALVEAPAGARAPARLVSPAARTDPHIQGASFFYLAPSRAVLLPGATVTVSLESGTAVSGGLVPPEALLWYGGRVWVYVNPEADRFVRTPIRTDLPVTGGFLVPELSPGTRIVVEGAGLLLSEELRSQVGVGEEGSGP